MRRTLADRKPDAGAVSIHTTLFNTFMPRDLTENVKILSGYFICNYMWNWAFDGEPMVKF